MIVAIVVALFMALFAVGSPAKAPDPQRTIETSIPAGAIELVTARFDGLVFPADPVIAPGGESALIVELHLGNVLRLCAHDETGVCRGVELDIEPHEGVTIGPLILPPVTRSPVAGSERDIDVLGGTVRLTRSIHLDDVGRSAESLVLRGRLRLQVCDLKRCYSVEDVAVKWELAVRTAQRESGNVDG